MSVEVQHVASPKMRSINTWTIFYNVKNCFFSTHIISWTINMMDRLWHTCSPIRRCKVSNTRLFGCCRCGNVILYSLSAAAAFPLQEPQTKCMSRYCSLVNIFDMTSPLELVGISLKQEEVETLQN